MIARFSNKTARPEILEDQIFFTRLAEGVLQTKKIQLSGLERQRVFFKKAKKLIHTYSVSKVKCTATAFARTAENTDELLALANDYGFSVDIISAEEEAKIGRKGALFDLLVDPKQTVVLDIGGASTEISAFKEFFSLSIGSVNLTEQFLLKDPPSEQELQNLKNHIQQQISRLPVSIFHKNSILVASAGTPTTLMALEQEQKQIELLHGGILNIHQIQQWYSRLISMSIKERKKLKAMPAFRADVIISGISVLVEIMNHFHWTKCMVSTTGLRYGLIYT